jgi:DNA-binding IclR family transcriptional regulator
MSMARAAERSRHALGVQSIEVGLRLLRPLIDAGRPLNLKVLAETAGFAPPKAHRYLVSFINAGLIEQDMQTGRYGLGALAFELGLNALGLLDHDKLARTTLSELELESGQSACLVVWRNKGPIVAAVESSPQLGTVFIAMRVGSTLSMVRTASGRIFLAFLPRNTISAILAKELRSGKMSVVEINELIGQIRRRGYSTSKDGTIPGISAISAPIFDHESRLVYALTLFGPTASLDVSPKSRVLRILQRKASELSGRLGHREKNNPRRVE